MMQENLCDFRDNKPFVSQVKGVKAIIVGVLPERVLAETVNELQTNNGTRNELCQFDMLIDRINHVIDGEENLLQLYT